MTQELAGDLFTSISQGRWNHKMLTIFIHLFYTPEKYRNRDGSLILAFTYSKLLLDYSNADWIKFW